MDKYLLRLKSIKDQLTVAGEFISNNDVIIAALAGLPKEYATIRTVILARDTTISMKEFRALLLGAERENDFVFNSLSHSMSALYMNGAASSSSSNSQFSSCASSSNSADVESSTGGRITAVPQVPYGSLPPGFPSQPYGFVPYFPPQNFGYRTGIIGSSNTESRSGQFSGTNQYNGGQQQQQRPYNGGQQRNNGGYMSNYKCKGSNGYKQNNTWNGNTESRITLHHECQICQRRGHTAPNCFFRTSQTRTNVVSIECQICGKRGHTALECYHSGNYAYQPTGIHVSQAPTFTASSSVPSVSSGSFLQQQGNSGASTPFMAHYSYHVPRSAMYTTCPNISDQDQGAYQVSAITAQNNSTDATT